MSDTDAGGRKPHAYDRDFLLLVLAALGVVFGSIGTSPLYALKECFGPHYGLVPTRENVLGVLSLVFWSLVLVISLKYVVFVLRADNRGEGGILALTALVVPRTSNPKGRNALLLAMGLFGAALLYGDGIITPAISVLSAVEGLHEVTPVFSPYVVPITVILLIGLFMFQKRGTAGVGAVFGPVVLVWFLTIALLGIGQIIRMPAVLAAVNPFYSIKFFVDHRLLGFLVLGSVFLVATGGEALYADMGHFGRRPIRFAWFALVLPALLLNYFGQGALYLQHEINHLSVHPFFDMAPRWGLIPLVALSTAATITASQAVISGAFSLSRQAVQLGYSPRLEIDHTSEHHIGQIYVGSVNWVLMIACIFLVAGFGSSSSIAAAYGVTVTTTMVFTTLLFFVVARERWHWPLWYALPMAAFFLLVDLAFFGANIIKIAHGGWVPLVIAGPIFLMMDTWKRGRAILRSQIGKRSLPIDTFLTDLARHPERRVPGTAVFMTGTAEGVPAALLHNMKHNKIVHERVMLLTVLTEEIPRVPDERRIEIAEVGQGLYRAIARYGFAQDPDMSQIVAALGEKGCVLKPMDTTYYLGRETLLLGKDRRLSRWRKKLFRLMARNANSATAYFGIPPNRVVELGTQIEI